MILFSLHLMLEARAGFGEGTPQQVRPASVLRFQFLKLWPQVDTCLSLFSKLFPLWLSKSAAAFSDIPTICGKTLALSRKIWYTHYTKVCFICLFYRREASMTDVIYARYSCDSQREASL